MQLGSHSGSRLARVLFFVFYWTLVAPLGLLSRRSRQRPAVHRELPAPTGMQSQY
jgi:hypothetical protein